jgi:hypothetical protein
MNETTHGETLFRVRARGEDVHHGWLVREPSFEAAAVAYVERMPLLAGEHTVGVIVRDVETGHEHTFHLHLDPGETPTVV